MMDMNKFTEYTKTNPTTEQLEKWVKDEMARFYNEFEYFGTLMFYRKELIKKFYLGVNGWKIANGEGTKDSIKAKLKKRGFYMDYMLDWYLDLRFEN